MTIINANDEKILEIGRQGENGRTQIIFDISDMWEEFPGGAITLVNVRPEASDGYLATELVVDNNSHTVTWTIMDYDLVQRGKGLCQLIYADANGIVCKSKTWPTHVSIGLQTADVEPPDWEDWKSQLLSAAATVAPLVDEVNAKMAGLDEALETAAGFATDAEAWARGTRDGEEVTEEDETYQKNGAYYAIIAGRQAEAAEESAVAAAESAEGAAESASEAAGSASDADSAKAAATAAQEKAEQAKTATETAQGKAEDAQAAAEAVLDSIPTDYTTLDRYQKLLAESLPNTVESYEFSGGRVSKAIHKEGETTIRTDVYTYGGDSITETRTLNTGEKLIITTNTKTLETTTVYQAAG